MYRCLIDILRKNTNFAFRSRNHIKSGQSERCPTDVDSLKIVPALGPQQEFHFYHIERKLWRCDEWRYDVKTKSLKNNLCLIAFLEIRPISFRSENRVLYANLIDKTAHFRRVQKRKNAFKTNDLFCQFRFRKRACEQDCQHATWSNLSMMLDCENSIKTNGF